MFRNQRLNEQIIGRNPYCHEVEDQFPGVFPQFDGVIGHGHGVVVHYAIHTFVGFLEINPVFYGPKIVAKMHVARRLNAGEYTFFITHGTAV